MAGLSSELYHRCRSAFMQCTEFDSNTSLRALFVTEELAPFANALPEASSKAGRVDAILAYLIDKRLRDGRGALSLFVSALRDRYDASDALWSELDTLLSSLPANVEKRKGDQPRPKIENVESCLVVEIEKNPPPSELQHGHIWKRLEVTNQGVADITGCLAKVVSVERLASVIDPSQGQQVPEFEPGWLSWVPAQFQPITIKPGMPVMLDLLLKLPNQPLRVALSSKLGAIREIQRIGARTDCLALPDAGRYLIRVSVESNELSSLEKCYTFYWDGRHENFPVEEVRLDRSLEARQASRLLSSSKAALGTVALVVPADVGSLEAVLRSIVDRTGSRRNEPLKLFVALRSGIQDPEDTIRIAMWLYHPDQITRKVDLPIVGDESDLRNVDAYAPDEPDAKPGEIVAVELTRRDEFLDAITCKLLRLDAARTEVLLAFSHPTAREYCKVLIKEILRLYPSTEVESDDKELARIRWEKKSITAEASVSASPTSVASALNTERAWAVLVGVNHYENQPHIPSLHVCVDDVTAVHAALAGKYTAARLLTDGTREHLPTRANILAELSSVAQAASEGDLLLFYFSGHGIAEGGESYLLPRDARLAALKHTAVAMKDVREIIDASPARAKVIVVDACHSGAAIGKAGPAMTPEFIERVFTEAEGVAVLASCKQGQQSWEWPEQGRSVFTHYLLEALGGKADFDGKGFITVSDASRYVADGVKAWGVDHGVPQTPTLQYTVAGDIILINNTWVRSPGANSEETVKQKGSTAGSEGVTIGNVSGGIHGSIIAGGNVSQTVING